MKKYFLLLIFSICFLSSLKAQNTYNIIFSQNSSQDNRCSYFDKYFKIKPKEVYFGIIREGNKLYIQVTDKNWAIKLFKKSDDGIAIDVVSKSSFACDKEIEESQIKGILLKPVFAKQIVRSFKPTAGNRFKAYVGTIPEKLRDEELEFNMLFLNNRVLCRYQTTFNLESYPWDLLDMGIYLDSLTFKNKKIKTSDKVITKFKNLKFVIPFQKNKSEYLPKDIKPLYDSLRLTDFNIKKINIKAYSSIEGSLERNLKLQKQRASSIAKSLQSFQKPDIVTEISSSENWVEFLNDITNTKFKNLKKLDKKTIKKKVVGSVSKELEVYLKNHRKAVVLLELEKKDLYKNIPTNVLISKFNALIKEDKLEEAKVVQNSIFKKIKEENSPNNLSKLNVPKQLKYIPFLNKNSIIKYDINLRYAKVAFDELKMLEILDPKSKRIKYNLVVLKFIIWRYNWENINEDKFKNQILTLKKYGVEKNLIARMLVNFHIVKAEKNLKAREYDKKDESIEFIIDSYDDFKLSNYDYLSLAQFLTYYSNIDDATDLLDKKVREITIDEDLLFYYLNLTITNDYNVASDNYRTIMLNAINMNKERFCKLFNSNLEKGVTFQLLDNSYLKKTYCENCK